MRLFLILFVLNLLSLNYAQITGLSGSAISGTSSSLSWTDGGADPDGPTTFYQIYMGSAVGAQNYANSGQFPAPSSGMTVIGTFPTTPGLTIYARLWHKHGSIWKYTNTTFSSFSGTPPPSTTPAITSPTPSSLVSTSGFTMTWTPGSATIFWVYVGTSSGASNLYNSGQLPSGTTSIAVPSFTASGGATIFVRLWYKVGSTWKYLQSSVTVDTTDPFEVTTLADSGTGSLRDVIAYVASVGGGTVTFDPALSGGTILLSSPISIPDTTSGITIPGLGESFLSISGGGSTGLFTVATGASLTISDLTLEDGSASLGGAILADLGGNTLTVSDCTFSSNLASSSGGAIYSVLNTLTVSDCTFTSNSTSYSAGPPAVRFGGAIYSDRDLLTISSSTFTSNFSDQGGAIYLLGSSSDADILSSTFTSNYAHTGGAISTFGKLDISTSTFNLNYSEGDHGTLRYQGGTGVTNTIISCTFSANEARPGGGFGDGNGGVVFHGESTNPLTLTNSTFALNKAPGSSGNGGAFRGSGLTFKGCIIVGNSARGSLTSNGPNILGAITSLGYNLVGNTADASGFAGTDIIGISVTIDSPVVGAVSPVLDALAANGGPTLTHALLSGSSAIDSGDPADVSPDQRGAPSVGTKDRGAFEFGGTPP